MTNPARSLTLASLLPLAIGLTAGCSAAPGPEPATAKAAGARGPSLGQTAEVAPAGEGLCPTLCSLRPSYAGLHLPKPRLAFHTTSGEALDEAKLRGKVLVIHLWSEPRTEVFEDLPELAKLTRSLGTAPDVAVFSVSVDEAPARARQAFKELLDNEHPYGFVVGRDAQSLASILGPERLPATWVIDQRGVIRARFDGRAPLSKVQMRALIDGLRGNQGCSLEIEDGHVSGGACEPGP